MDILQQLSLSVLTVDPNIPTSYLITQYEIEEAQVPGWQTYAEICGACSVAPQ